MQGGKGVVLHVSIHAPLAGRDDSRCRLAPQEKSVSIHAPLAGRDREGSDGVLEIYPLFCPPRPQADLARENVSLS